MPHDGSVAIETDLSYGDFVRNYLKPGRPVLLRGALAALPAGAWTPEALRDRYGDKTFELEGEPVRFGEFVDQVLESDPDHPAPYLRNVGVGTDFPELIPDLQPGLSYARANWRFLPVLPKWWFGSSSTYCQFFLTGPGRGFPFMHVDYPPMHTFSALSFGRKEWLLYAPDQTPYLYPGSREGGWPVVSQVENPFDPDLERFPKFAEATGASVMQEAGDLLFVPTGWWHTTRSHSVTVAVAWDHLCASSWKPYSRYRTGSPAFTRKSAPYRALVKTYLSLIGNGLTLRDAVARPFVRNARTGRIA